MFKQDARFCTPSISTMIWRYMKFYKFEDLVQHRKLYFRRIIDSEDKFEASVPCHSKYNTLRAITVNEEPMTGVRGFGRFQFINCWSIDNYESDALWRLYIQDKNGIAIQTTVGDLLTSLSNSPLDIRIGKVKYIDHSTYCYKEHDHLKPMFFKSMQFRYENELRLITTIDLSRIHDYKSESIIQTDNDHSSSLDGVTILRCDTGIQGIKIDVDIDQLVRKIYLPTEPSDELVHKCHLLLEKVNLLNRLNPSQCGREPWY